MGEVENIQIVGRDEFIKIIREFINDNFLFGNNGEIKEETSFLENGIIDSTGILELIAFLEEKYAISIEDEEIVPENMDSLLAISEFLSRKMAQGANRESTKGR